MGWRDAWHEVSARRLLGVRPSSLGLQLLAAASESAARALIDALVDAVPVSPWHVAGTLNGSTAEWLINPPGWASIRGRQTVVATNAGTDTDLNSEDLIRVSGAQTIQGDNYGQWSRHSTAASIGATVGYYCISPGSSPFPRPCSKYRGFCTLAEVKVVGTTNRRLVFGMHTSTADSGGIASVTNGVTQSTTEGYFLVLASDASSATTVYYYSSATGVGATAAVSTGITVSTDDVLVLALYTLAGAPGAVKQVGWSVYNLTTMTAFHGDFSAGTPGVNEPTDGGTFFPVLGLRTLAASAIPNDVKRLALWES